MLAKVGTGEIIYSLRKTIQDIQSELNQLDVTVNDLPEMINSANLIRKNEYLVKVNEKQRLLIDAYVKYSKELEEMLSSVFAIQEDLKDILKEQSKLIASRKKQSKTKPRKK